jgi:plastocyanin
MKKNSSQTAPENAMQATETPAVTETTAMQPSGSTGAAPEAGLAKSFTLDASEFKYDMKTLTVKKGDTVKITLTNSGKMMHDWAVDEFNAKTKRITNGQTDTVTFVADKTGTFEYYCSVGQHRANGMTGKLTVE